MTSAPRLHLSQNYIGGRWVTPAGSRTVDIVSPVTEEPVGELLISGAACIGDAVEAAASADESMRHATIAERAAMLQRLLDAYQARSEDMAGAISEDIGAPISFSRRVQAPIGARLLSAAVDALQRFPFEESVGNARVRREAIGVCGLITPWNWPMNQIVAKVASAFAAGCPVVLKPSEFAPRCAHLFAEIVDAAKLPAGSFNLVQGNAVAGEALAAHPRVRLISITGSTRAGCHVAQTAAPGVKRVVQELGGKSPYIVGVDSDVESAVRDCVTRLCTNSGQSCNAPSRLLVPREHYDRALEAAAAAAAKQVVGDPFDAATTMGPLVNARQFRNVSNAILQALHDGAQAVCGGPHRPGSMRRGFFIEPTVLADVGNDMTIAREEVFGPVLCVIPCRDLDDAIEVANDTPYGLAAYVFGDEPTVEQVGRRVDAGMIYANGAVPNVDAPFGGFKQSGNGRERGRWGIEEFLETKAIFTG